MREVEDDGVLLRAVARGDRAAFGVLHDRIAPMLLLRLRRRCADDEVVADVLQETFLAVWRSASTWTGDGDVAAWVWTIASRRLIDAYRRRRAAEQRASAEASDRLEEVPSAEHEALRPLLDEPLAAALGQLSPELRAVLQATVLDGLSTREAGVLLGIPEGTVKTRARRARLQLREALS